jgi:hypothetical protein
MDSATTIALAVGVLLCLLQDAVKDMPWFITWPGICVVCRSHFVEKRISSGHPYILATAGDSRYWRISICVRHVGVCDAETKRACACQK